MKNVPSPGARYNNIIYSNDGTGRDSYIYGNNGGNTTYTFPSVQNKPASIQFQNPYRRYNCRVAGKAPRYIQNGSGRDGYISHNDGGFSSPHQYCRKLGQGS